MIFHVLQFDGLHLSNRRKAISNQPPMNYGAFFFSSFHFECCYFFAPFIKKKERNTNELTEEINVYEAIIMEQVIKMFQYFLWWKTNKYIYTHTHTDTQRRKEKDKILNEQNKQWFDIFIAILQLIIIEFGCSAHSTRI